MATKRKITETESDVSAKRPVDCFRLLAKSHVFFSRSLSRKLGFLLVLDLQSGAQRLLTVRSWCAFRAWDSLHVGLKYRCLGPVERPDGMASFLEEESLSSSASGSQLPPPEANPWPVYTGTVIEISPALGSCKIEWKVGDEPVVADLIYAPLFALGVSLPVIKIGDTITAERSRYVEKNDHSTVLFADGGSLLKVNGKTCDGIPKDVPATVSAFKAYCSGFQTTANPTSPQRPPKENISPWFLGLHRFVAILGYYVTPYYSWLEQLAVVLQKKFVSLLSDGNLVDENANMAFKCLTTLCRAAGAPLPEIDFDFEDVARRDFQGELEPPSDDVISGLRRITKKSPVSSIYPSLSAFAVALEDFKQSWAWSIGSREFLPSAQVHLGYFSGCTSTGKALFKDASAAIAVVFEIPPGKNGPDLTWMNRPCIVRNLVSYYETIFSHSFSYAAVNVNDVQFLAPAVIPPVEEVNKDGKPRSNHKVWIVDKSRIVSYNTRPSFLLDVVFRLETPDSSTSVVQRHSSRTILMDGRFLAMLHPYLRPGTCTIWSFRDEKWKTFPEPRTLSPLTTAGVYVSTKDFLKIYPTEDATSPLPAKPNPEKISNLALKKVGMIVPLVQGTITDVYRSGYGEKKPQLRLNISHEGSNVSLYCDEPGSTEMVPLGMLSFREVLVSNVECNKSQMGNFYLRATLKTDFQLGRVMCDEEFAHREAPLTSLHRSLVETSRWRHVKFLVRHVRRFGNLEFSTVCSVCKCLVPNHSLNGPHCSRCTGGSYTLEAKAVFMVNDGTCGAFLLEARDMDVLTLLGFRGNGKNLFVRILRQIRRFTLAPKNKAAVLIPDGPNHARYQKARAILQHVLKITHPTKQLLVTAKVFMYTGVPDIPMRPGWVRFKGRLFCRRTAVVETVKIPDDWLARTPDAASQNWAKSHSK